MVHELALCEAIADTVSTRAEGRPVRGVLVQIGHFRQVVPDALVFAWEMITTGTPLEGSTIEIDHVPATVRCRSCDATTTLDMPVLACSACSGTDVELLTGEEFTLVSIEVGVPKTEPAPD